jgi:DNA adenine methylase
MPQYPSPLRYPGGKGRLYGVMRRLLQRNGLEDGHYVEAFAGGASIALGLLFDEMVAHVHINDLDRSVFAFWHATIHENAELCRRVYEVRVTPAEWKRQRDVQRLASSASLLDLGFSTFFLNRTNRSGIIGSGGMIGGTRQNGKWKIDARYNRRELVRRLERVAAYGDRISIYNLDAADFLKSALRRIPLRTLVYLDPPYYVKGQQRLYSNWYRHDDHGKLASRLEAVAHKWVVTYDRSTEVERLYERYRRRRYHLSYSASSPSRGSEVMIFSDGLRIPRSLGRGERSPG